MSKDKKRENTKKRGNLEKALRVVMHPTGMRQYTLEFNQTRNYGPRRSMVNMGFASVVDIAKYAHYIPIVYEFLKR